MSVDLQSNSTFGRISIVLMNDCLIKLEHGWSEDRTRRFMYEGIDSVVIWRKIPWVRIMVCAVLLALPGIILLFLGNIVATVCGIVLGAIGVALIVWYLYCRSTTIRIVRAGKNHDLTSIFRPGKVRSFRDRLVVNIRTIQASESNTSPSK
jgi:hypothetical protein